MKYFYQIIESPIGNLYVASDEEEQVLKAVCFEENWNRIREKFGEHRLILKDSPLILQAKRELEEYFRGERVDFEVPANGDGTTFQKAVWKTLKNIPYGQRITYSEQARWLNHPKAVRAIGRTNGLNPLSIILPCHRVVGKSGKLTGYAGGLEVKEYLLALEEKFGGGLGRGKQ